MIKKLDLKDEITVWQVLKLQKASYKIEAELIDFYEIPPLKDTIESLKECEEIFYGYYIGDMLAGIISYRIIDCVLDIHRVAVHPEFFRMGVADKLVSYIEAVEGNINKVIVSTGKKNMPAVNLYLKRGYKRIKDINIEKDFYITEFEKVL
jgi:ribosomal protein S18 acetylase RimI-like enzyme